MREVCDFVVIGLGAMGSAALASLSEHGRVIGLEAVAPGHAGGSSHGESRIFRVSNFESPAYTPLAERSLAVWRGLEREAGEVYLPTGLLEAGASDSPIIAGRAGDTSLERLSPADVHARYPVFDLPDGWSATFQRDAGILRADAAIRRQIESVRQPDAVRIARAVSIEQRGDGVEVTTADGQRIAAAAAVVTAGPWITALIPALAGRIRVTLQTIGWFAPAPAAPVGLGQMPVFAFETGDAMELLYGFPDFAGLGVKAAAHAHGPEWSPGSPRPDQATQRAALAQVQAGLKRFVPGAGPLRATTTCLYSNTADEEFIVDRCPGRPNIVFASACSGHGFKFAPAIGAMLSELARDPGAVAQFPL